MTGTEIAALCIAGAGVLLIFLSLIFFSHSRKVKRSCTAQTTGKVVRYRCVGHDNGRTYAPVVEYSVNTMLYEAYRRYKGVVHSHRTSFNKSECEIYVSKRDVLHVKCVGLSVDIGAAMQERWPLGSSMTVYYDPEDPKRGFVEKVVVISDTVGVVLLCVGLGLLALAGLFYMIF